MVWKMVVDAEGRRSGPNGVISPVVEAKKCRGLNGEISPIVEMTGSIDDGWLVDSPASGEAGQRENHIIL